MRKKITVIIILAVFLCGTASAQNPTNLLDNPGFEGSFYQYQGIGELSIAEDWRPWYVEDGTLHRPEYKPELAGQGSGRVHSGEKAQKQFTTYSTHQGGVYQVVEGVIPGEWYKFSAWVYVWSSGDNDPDRSTGHGKYSALVGINPWGDERAWYRTTVWGKEALAVYNQWVQVEVTAQAWTDKIVVFTYGTPAWPVLHNDSYWDDASLALRMQSCPCPEPPPCPAPEPCEVGVDYERIKAGTLAVLAEWDRR